MQTFRCYEYDQNQKILVPSNMTGQYWMLTLSNLFNVYKKETVHTSSSKLVFSMSNVWTWTLLNTSSRASQLLISNLIPRKTRQIKNWNEFEVSGRLEKTTTYNSLLVNSCLKYSLYSK